MAATENGNIIKDNVIQPEKLSEKLLLFSTGRTKREEFENGQGAEKSPLQSLDQWCKSKIG